MTTRVNLLPWREMRRKEQDRQLLSIGIFLWMLMGLIVFYAHLHVSSMIEGQKARNDYLKSEIATLDKVIDEIKDIKKKRQDLISRMEVIYKLQNDRTQLVRILDEMARTLPEGAYYRSLKQQGALLVLQGSAQSNARVSALMRNFDASPWFENPDLQVVNVGPGTGGSSVSNFTLHVKQRSQPDEKNMKPQAGPVKR